MVLCRAFFNAVLDFVVDVDASNRSMIRLIVMRGLSFLMTTIQFDHSSLALPDTPPVRCGSNSTSLVIDISTKCQEWAPL